MHMEAAGEAVLVTFDRAGRTSRSFSPLVDGRLVRFVPAGGGKMKDSASGSVWNIVTGECESGPLRGKRLTPRTGETMVVCSRRGPMGEQLAS